MGNDLTGPHDHNPKTAAQAGDGMGTPAAQWLYCFTVECVTGSSVEG